MGRIVVVNWVSLDGVMQGPGAPGEDPRGGFEHSGWAAPYSDGAMQDAIGAQLTGDFAWLFGRWTYEDLLTAWNERGGPFRESLNSTRKYVASGSAETTLAWPNSELLHGDVPAAVAELSRTSDTTLVIMGSGKLIGSLMVADLIDRYLLFTAPLVLGGGRRLFPGGTRVPLRLLDSTTAATGAIVATYELVR